MTSKDARRGNSQVSTNVLAADTLDEWTAAHPDRLSVTHVLSREAADSAWSGARGFIDRGLVERHMPGPDEDCLLFICAPAACGFLDGRLRHAPSAGGPPAMYDALCGPRQDEALSGLLAEMGYTADQGVKF